MTLTEIPETDVYSFVGGKLRELRKAHGMTQAAAAEIIGVSPQQYQKYEDAQSKCSLPNLLKLAAFYSVPLSVLLPPDHGSGAEATDLPNITTEADLLARLVSSFVKLDHVDEKVRLVQLVEAIVAAQSRGPARDKS